MQYLEAKALGKQMKGAPANKMLPGPPENKEAAVEGADTIEGVRFGSPSAHKKAEEAGLTAAAFKGKRKSSEKGFTLADVERIAAAADAAEAEEA